MIKDEEFKRGIELRQAMFGPGQEAAVDSAPPLTEKLQEIVTRWCFGDIWQREGLSRRDRSLITVAMMVALGRATETRHHMGGALANGVSDVELREVCLHALLYAGIPATAEALNVLEGVLASEGGPAR
ncbi:carboxymuconolactone decarboxylase family protein [Streptomyces sp. NPDC002588]|uniref:carboxymuconolactone decarboxylase family protein n=1 Tax=Streptomyces sp. NPDC002588 TaxID=3154419 RepID=UPI003321F0B0